MSANIDQITPSESCIDLSRYAGSEFALPEHILTTLFDDLLLAEYADISQDGNSIKRGDLYIPLNTAPRAWRTGIVRLVGSKCTNVNVGDTVIFPNNNGILVTNMQYSISSDDTQTVGHGVFLNEERLFGVCKSIDESSPTDTTSSS